MSFIKRLMEIKEWQKINEARQTYLLLEILEELKHKETWFPSGEVHVKCTKCNQIQQFKFEKLKRGGKRWKK